MIGIGRSVARKMLASLWDSEIVIAQGKGLEYQMKKGKGY
jgi:hypothetical protein